MSTATTKDPSSALSLLKRAHSPETAEKIYTEKIVRRPLHLKPSTNEPSNAQTQRRAARLEKRATQKRKKKALKPAPLSSRQKKALCLYDIPRERQNYELYVPLHELWVKYIQDLLGLTVVGGGEGGKREKRNVTPVDAGKLCAADFHGALVKVLRSRCVSRVGICGIVVKDGRGAFDLISKGKGKGKGGEIKRVPKEGTMFAFEIPLPDDKVKTTDQSHVDDMEVDAEAQEEPTKLEKDAEGQHSTGKMLKFEIHGDQFIYRAADRANRKFKPHFLPNL